MWFQTCVWWLGLMPNGYHCILRVSLNLPMLIFPNLKPYKVVKHFWLKVLDDYWDLEFMSKRHHCTTGHHAWWFPQSLSIFIFLILRSIGAIKYFWSKVFNVSKSTNYQKWIHLSSTVNNFFRLHVIQLIRRQTPLAKVFNDHKDLEFMSN